VGASRAPLGVTRRARPEHLVKNISARRQVRFVTPRLRPRLRHFVEVPVEGVRVFVVHTMNTMSGAMQLSRG